MLIQDQFNRTVINVGDSKGFTIPKGVQEQMEISEGEEIDVFIRKKPQNK